MKNVSFGKYLIAIMIWFREFPIKCEIRLNPRRPKFPYFDKINAQDETYVGVSQINSNENWSLWGLTETFHSFRNNMYQL